MSNLTTEEQPTYQSLKEENAILQYKVDSALEYLEQQKMINVGNINKIGEQVKLLKAELQAYNTTRDKEVDDIKTVIRNFLKYEGDTVWAYRTRTAEHNGALNELRNLVK